MCCGKKAVKERKAELVAKPVVTEEKNSDILEQLLKRSKRDDVSISSDSSEESLSEEDAYPPYRAKRKLSRSIREKKSIKKNRVLEDLQKELSSMRKLIRNSNKVKPISPILKQPDPPIIKEIPKRRFLFI